MTKSKWDFCEINFELSLMRLDQAELREGVGEKVGFGQVLGEGCDWDCRMMLG